MLLKLGPLDRQSDALTTGQLHRKTLADGSGGSKLLVDLKVDSAFCPSKDDQMSTRNFWGPIG